MIAEQSLWVAVIEEAFTDASRATHKKNHCGNVVPTYNERHVYTAQSFLTRNTEWFRCVCDMADLDPEWVMAKYDKFVSAGFKRWS